MAESCVIQLYFLKGVFGWWFRQGEDVVEMVIGMNA